MNQKLEKYDEYLQHLFDTTDPNIKLDADQKKVVVCSETPYVMVLAGAGCGKTTTMAAKVKFLIDCEKIDPHDILMISYTNKAISELRNQLHHKLHCPVEISTFHHYAYHLVKSEKNLSVFTKGEELIYQYFLSTGKKISTRKKKLFQLYQYYFSTGLENSISTFWIPYCKEFFFSCGKLSYLEQKYCDEWSYFVDKYGLNVKYYAYHSMTKCHYFCLLQIGDQNIYIDYLSSGSSFAEHLYSKWSYKKRRQQAVCYHLHYLMIEQGESIEEKIKEYCINHHIPFGLTHSWNSFISFVQHSSSLTILFRDLYQFILLWKRRGYNENDFERKIYENTNWNSEEKKIFIILKEVYQYYQNYLQQNQLLDFEDMILQATILLQQKEIPLPKYVIVDEYQDISHVRFLFLQKLVEKAHAKLTVVGDDWQSIYAFAGSDIELFIKYDHIFSTKENPVQTYRIQKTYRNSQSLIDIAGHFIMKNKKQLSKKLISPKQLKNPLKLFYYYNDQEKVKKLIKILEEIYTRNPKDRVLLLSRFHHDISFLSNHRLFSLNHEQVIYQHYPDMHIDFLTIHAAKGLGYDQVIILNNEEGIYGFPSLKEDHPFIHFVEEIKLEDRLMEERRLFYVALTRTKNYTYLLVSKNRPSRFIQELKKEKLLSPC